MQSRRRGRHCLIASCSPGGNVPTLRSGVTSAGQRHESSCDTPAPAASPNSGSLLGSGQDCCLALERWSLVFIAYANCLRWLRQHKVTSEQMTAISSMYWKPRYFVIGIWRLITPLSNNIFSWNLAVHSQIHPKTNAHNFMKINSDLAFLLQIV